MRREQQRMSAGLEWSPGIAGKVSTTRRKLEWVLLWSIGAKRKRMCLLIMSEEAWKRQGEAFLFADVGW
jgi:hypothetical protein